MASGIVIIDKPSGWTSMDVCAKIRGILKEKRVGHGGTLDPMATGVLPVFVGQATRAVEFAENGEKEYIAGLRLGLVTNTQDTSGETLETHPVTVDRAALEAVLPRFTGPIAQIPPMYSAIKINGQKLYDLARKGKEVERKPRNITIFELELLEQVSETDYLLRCRCSKEHICGHCAMTSGKRWAAAALCSVSAAPWPLSTRWQKRSPLRMYRPKEKLCCGLWNPCSRPIPSTPCPLQARKPGSATATPLRCRSWRTAPIGSMAKTVNFSVFPVPKTAR